MPIGRGEPEEPSDGDRAKAVDGHREPDHEKHCRQWQKAERGVQRCVRVGVEFT
jgi:hypothetical protein